MNADIVLFPGCMIKFRIPFIEVSIRKVLNFFRINFSESVQFSCCPEPNGIKNTNSLIYNITAARNLAIAEKLNSDILTPCNGCFETLKSVRSEIRVDPHIRDELNDYLQKINLKVNGSSDVLHLIEFFNKLGSSTIKDEIIYPLNGLRVAVHYGCHFLRPSDKIQMDDPLEPHLFDNLIEDLGARSVDYVHKMTCCGGSLERAGAYEMGLEMIHSKLKSLKQARADVIVVGCPQCFIQFDHLQQELKKIDYHYDIPVLYYSELLCIALGVDIQDIIMKSHKTPTESIFKKVELIHNRNAEINKYFDTKFLVKCIICSACDNDCPVSKHSDFKPSHIVQKLVDGKIDDAINDPMIWKCLDCYICYEFCPMRTGLVDVFTSLRNIATSFGLTPKGFDREFESFYQNGFVGVYSKTAIKKVGLDTQKPQTSDLKELFNIIKED